MLLFHYFFKFSEVVLAISMLKFNFMSMENSYSIIAF
jgi:hypothetical protein